MQIWSGAVLRLSFDSGFRVWRFRAFWALGFLGPCERERVRERERGSGVFRFWFRGLGFRVLGFSGFGGLGSWGRSRPVAKGSWGFWGLVRGFPAPKTSVRMLRIDFPWFGLLRVRRSGRQALAVWSVVAKVA